jgi:hypothetical protein
VLGLWNTDGCVLLRLATCDNTENAGLRGVLWYRMKFTRFLAPNSLELLDLRVKIRADGCRHCHCASTVVAHGYLKGNAASGYDTDTRGLRFYCSDRFSNIGCGGTFSIHWDSVIPYCTLRTVELLDLLRAVACALTTHGAWAASKLVLSTRTAYRWVARWRILTTHLRARLCLVAPPPGKTDDQPDLFTLRHLTAAFPTATCPIAAFQQGLQVPITG